MRNLQGVSALTVNVSYKDTYGRLVLCRSKANEKVYNVHDCLFDNWFKDNKGGCHD